MSNENLAHEDQRHAVYLLYFDDGTDIAAQIAADLRNIGYDVWQNSSAVVSVATPDNTHSYAMAHSAVILLVGTPPEDFLSSPVENSTLAQIPEDVYLAHVIVRPDTHISDLDTFDLTYWRNPTVYQRISGLLSEKIRNIVNDVQLDVPDRETQFINQFSARMERLRYPIFTTVETTSGIMHRWPRRQVFISELTGGPSFTLHEVREYHRSFVITGIPGSGKSTLLLNTARDVLRAYQARRQEFPFPLPLSLAYWNNDEAFDSFLSRNWPLDETFNELLSNGRILLLVDDFETISEQQTDELANWLADHPETQCIIATYPVFGAERLEFPVFGIVGFDQPG
ncbi:MAG: NACHT domain-containing protein, partial [Chloroflexota bacterium]